MPDITRVVAQHGEHTQINSPFEAPPREQQIAERQAVITAGLQRVDADPAAREDTHGELRDKLMSELDALRTERSLLTRSEQAAARAEKIAEITRHMTDPANLERPVGAPPLVKGLGDRRETGAEVLQRMQANPWRHEDGGPLHRAETGAGLVSRAHSALEGLEDTLTRDGCQKLADAMAEESTWPGVMIRRSKEEQAQAAELWLALSNPFYAEAFRSVLRYPAEFTGAGGTGFETLTDEQRQAWRDVRTK
jgi:hypothetical protein